MCNYVYTYMYENIGIYIFGAGQYASPCLAQRSTHRTTVGGTWVNLCFRTKNTRLEGIVLWKVITQTLFFPHNP